MTAYMYSLLQYQHSQDAGEWINVGLVGLTAKGETCVSVPSKNTRLESFCPNSFIAKTPEFEKDLQRKAALWSETTHWARWEHLGPEVFGSLLLWLLPPNHNCLRFSQSRCGVSPSPAAVFRRCFAMYVLGEEDYFKHMEKVKADVDTYPESKKQGVVMTNRTDRITQDQIEAVRKFIGGRNSLPIPDPWDLL